MRAFTVMIALALAGFVAAQDTEEPRPLMRDFIGINGHFKFRPKLYKPACRLVRNYHNINWDVARPGAPITIPVCVNKVNWQQVYGSWAKQGFEIDICLQFGRFGRGNKDYKQLWKGQGDWSYQYGKRIATYFGPSGKHKLATSIEIGNEPGEGFDDHLYRSVFRQIAAGIRAGDPAVRIVTCTAHARDADKYAKDLRKTFQPDEMQKLFDIINVHTYAIKPKESAANPWERSYPEDPTIDYLKVVDETIRWRNRHAPGKAIWITEFGYDACTPEAMTRRKGWFKKLNWTDVSDLQQAQYLLRSMLLFAERDVERAYIYYFNDADSPSVHAASGLTRHFKPKMAYWAVKHFYETLGEYRFNRVVQKEKARIYEFANAEDADQVIWVLWIPTESGKRTRVQLPDRSGDIQKLETMTTTSAPAAKEIPQGLTVEAGGSPRYIFIKR